MYCWKAGQNDVNTRSIEMFIVISSRTNIQTFCIYVALEFLQSIQTTVLSAERTLNYSEVFGCLVNGV